MLMNTIVFTNILSLSIKTKQTVHIQTISHTEISEKKQRETLKEHGRPNEFQITQ